MSEATLGASVAAAMMQASKASGVVVRVEPDDLAGILRKQERPLVVCAKGGLLTPNFQYLTSYKGLAFFAKSPVELELPFGAEVIAAKSIWVPDF